MKLKHAKERKKERNTTQSISRCKRVLKSLCFTMQQEFITNLLLTSSCIIWHKYNGGIVQCMYRVMPEKRWLTFLHNMAKDT